MKGSEQRLLLNLARESIRSYFKSEKPDVSHVKQFSDKQGVFVTLHDKSGRLRGCVGFPMPVHPLYVGIVEAARNAAFRDSRFSPVKESELNDLRVEVSVLSKPQKIEIQHYNDYLKAIKIGTDGLILESPLGSGLLLPQVATENNMNIQSFLNALSQKAGLSFNAWKEATSRIYKFQAEIFKEE